MSIRSEWNGRPSMVAVMASVLAWIPLEAAPVLPGIDRLRPDNEAHEILAGRILLGELSCTRCHADENASDSIQPKAAPDLGQAGARITPQYLTEFITSTHTKKPGTTMPDLFHSSDPLARDGAVEYLTHFLASLGGPLPPSQTGGSAKTLEWGKELYHSIGCVACHGPQDETAPEGFQPLGSLAEKTTVDALTQFLLNPHQIRSSGRMPSLWLTEDEARALSVFLLRAQLDNPQSKEAPPANMPGLNVDYYEIDGIGKLPDFTEIKPNHRAAVEDVSLDLPFRRRTTHYALRFHGQIQIKEAGNYTFATYSDDGSILRINGQVVVDNGGTHSPQMRRGDLALEPGLHDFEVAFFNAGGGAELRVFWRQAQSEGRGGPIPKDLYIRSGGAPMVPLNTRPFVVDEQKAVVGKRMFQAMRCASCHDLEGLEALSTSKALSQLDLESRDGCLSSSIRRGLPDFQLTQIQRRQIKAAIQQLAAAPSPLSPAQEVTKTLATFNCYACHERDGLGGPTDSIASRYFNTESEIDLGEEGKIPPTLNFVGAKLKSTAIDTILSSPSLHVRHYMKTRMPNFGLDNLKSFVENIGMADDHPALDANPEFSAAAAKIGRKLIGTTGLACITCHRIAGQNALAIQGIDLTSAFDRLNPSWFESFLLEPAKYNQDTRMPQFFPDGQSPFIDILEGNTKRQIEAMWSYLSLKNSLQLPEGIVPVGEVAMELIPMNTPIVHRTFMDEVGPRSILTGFPEKLNTAFDANVVRLAKVWRGRFFDHSGVESGRTDRFLKPLGEDILDLPPGPAFALLASPLDPWPLVEKTSRNTGGSFQGYALDAQGCPTFRYQLSDATIREKSEPLLFPGGTILKRSFTIERNGQSPLYFLAAQGQSITDEGDLTFGVDQSRIKLSGSPTPRPIFRTVDSGRQLLVPITQANSTLTQTIEW